MRIPLSAILRNRLKPSADFNFNFFAMTPQRSFALVHDSTSKSFENQTNKNDQQIKMINIHLVFLNKRFIILKHY